MFDWMLTDVTNVTKTVHKLSHTISYNNKTNKFIFYPPII